MPVKEDLNSGGGITKKKIAIFCISMLLVTGITACSFSASKDASGILKGTENGAEEDPFENENGRKEEKIISNSADPAADINRHCGNIISGNPEEMTLVYEGEPIVVEYEFQAEFPCVMGLMIYVNGLYLFHGFGRR